MDIGRMKCLLPGAVVFLGLLFQVVVAYPRFNDESSQGSSRPPKHEAGYCSMYDVCGEREDGKVLNCPNNAPAVLPSKSLSHDIQSLCPLLTGKVCCSERQFRVLQDSVKQAVPFLVGCPACFRNFLNFFCMFSCSPDQSLFVNVTTTNKIQTPSNETREVVMGVDFFVDSGFGSRFYNSCAEVKFAAMNTRAMQFIGGDARNYKEWFQFMGRMADPDQPGSPFLIQFPEATPPHMQPLNFTMFPCSDPDLACSCGDCPAAPGCDAPPPPPSTNVTAGCHISMGKVQITCLDATLVAVYLTYLVLVAVAWRMLSPRGTKSVDDTDGVDLQEPFLHEGYGESREPCADLQDNIESEGSGEIQPAVDIPDREEMVAVVRLEDDDTQTSQSCMDEFFRGLGSLCANHPLRVIAISIALLMMFGSGMTELEVETRPEKLWVSPGSRAAKEKAFYDEHLGPFYRVEQLILATRATSAKAKPPPITTKENINLMFQIQEKVDSLRASVGKTPVSLSNICFSPLGSQCATQSVLQYWQMKREAFDDDPDSAVDHAKFCFQHYSSSGPCLANFGGPVDPNVVLGGFEGLDYHEATAFTVTYPVRNTANLSDPLHLAAVAWEAAFINLTKTVLIPMVEKRGLTLAYSSESSVESELKRESSVDIPIIALSYLVMFVYVAYALGSTKASGPYYVKSKVLLGLSGILIVAGSVVGAVGICSFAHIKSTLIIVEVIPFLVLAVGADNMCILAHTLQRQSRTLPLERRVENTLAEAGPSITMASLSEVVAFSVGVFIPMPACQVFSLFAAIAVLLDYLLQITAFVALMTLDARRTEAGRVDCLPCMSGGDDAGDADFEDAGDADFEDAKDKGEGVLAWYMERVHAPILDREWVKVLCFVLFGGAFVTSIALAARLSPGLDQSIALPRDSYLQGYFRNITEYLKVGPPLYFVVKDYNYSSAGGQTNKLCSIGGCDKNSLPNQVALAARSPLTTTIARPAASWVDDFLVWMSPNAFGCCRQFPNKTYCPPDDQPPCAVDPFDPDPSYPCAQCSSCFLPADLLHNRPSADQFRAKLPWFLRALPSPDCAKGGRGAYSHSVDLKGFERGVIAASEYRTYHTPYRVQADLINCLKKGREFAAQISKSIQMEVFPYSVFYIFFEQYLNIISTAVLTLAFTLGAVFATCLLISGSLWTASVILIPSVMIVVDLMGLMTVWDIQLNAVSVVNLAMAAGISVEFCVHITHSFIASRGSRAERAGEALRTTGASVLSGITLTKVAGVSVLYFSRSEIFEVYYFRMYFGLVLFGALHGLVFLPVLLSVLGPPPIDKRRITVEAAAADDLQYEILMTSMDDDTAGPCRQQ